MNALRFFLLNVVLCLSSVTMFAQQGDWTIDYIPDEFGDPTSEKVITHYWDGIRDGGNSCVLGMRVAIRFGMQFALIYNFEKEDLAGLSVSAKFNNQRIPLEIESTENDYLYFTQESERKIYNCFMQKGVLKLSFLTDAYGIRHNRVFEITTPNGLYTASKNAGMMIRPQ